MTPVPGSPFNEFQLWGGAFHPSQPFVFLLESDAITTARIDPSTYAPSLVDRFESPGVGLPAIDHTGRRLFVSAGSQDRILSLAIDQSTGRLSLAEEMYSRDGNFGEMCLHPSGRLSVPAR